MDDAEEELFPGPSINYEAPSFPPGCAFSIVFLLVILLVGLCS